MEMGQHQSWERPKISLRIDYRYVEITVSPLTLGPSGNGFWKLEVRVRLLIPLPLCHVKALLTKKWPHQKVWWKLNLQVISEVYMLSSL